MPGMQTQEDTITPEKRLPQLLDAIEAYTIREFGMVVDPLNLNQIADREALVSEYMEVGAELGINPNTLARMIFTEMFHEVKGCKCLSCKERIK
tara:strand:+ start:12040 stop:12321 length:282 start_codon:yes stop_codon:yes gene_type:complete